MNILFLSDNFPPEKTAAASRVYERACYWVKWGHSVTVITCAPNFPEGSVYPGYRNRWYQTELRSGIRVVRVKTIITKNEGFLLRILDFLSYMVMAFIAGLFQPKPDVVAATSPQFFAAVGAWALSFVRRVPFVFEVSDLWPRAVVDIGMIKPNQIFRWLERLELFLYRRSAAVIALTTAFKEDLVDRGVPNEKVHVILNGVDLARFEPRNKNAALARQWGLSDADFVVGYIGTLGMAHALESVLDAVEIMQDLGVRLLLVGTGAAQEDLVARASRRNLKGVVFVPPHPKERMPDFWSLCDVALVHLKNIPLHRTVIPSKIFEAMAMGLPILLGCPAGEASKIIDDDECGVCVPAEDPKALAAAVLLLKGNAEWQRQLAANSLRAARLHTREAQARRTVDVLELASSRKNPAVSIGPAAPMVGSRLEE